MKFTEPGMTDPVVGRLTFAAVIGHEPSAEELARVVSHYLMRLPEEVAQSSAYRVLAGVEELGADYVLRSLEEDLPGTGEAGVWREGGGQPAVVPRGVNSSQVAELRIGPRTNLHPPSASRGNMYLQWSHRTTGVGAGR